MKKTSHFIMGATEKYSTCITKNGKNAGGMQRGHVQCKNERAQCGKTHTEAHEQKTCKHQTSTCKHPVAATASPARTGTQHKANKRSGDGAGGGGGGHRATNTRMATFNAHYLRFSKGFSLLSHLAMRTHKYNSNRGAATPHHQHTLTHTKQQKKILQE